MRKVLFLLGAIPIYLISMLPLRFHYFMSGVIVFFLNRVLGYRRSVIIMNFSRAFPHLRYDKIEELTTKFYKNLAEVIAESVKKISLSKKQISRMCRIENPYLMKKFYDKNVSVLFVGGHTGNWELLGKMEHFSNSELTGYKGEHINFVYKKQKSNFVNDILLWIRTIDSNVTLVESKAAARTILKNKDRPACYFLLSDQAPHPGSKFLVSFLNQPTLMINGPEVISRAAGCPVIFFDMVRENRGKYVVRLTEITDNPASCEPGYITNTFARLLEKSIQENPDNWLWSHKRWKRGVEDNELHKKNSFPAHNM